MANGLNRRLYASVARDLAARIADGEFMVGSRLPPERILSQYYAVSRATIREAVIALEVDGLVETRMGAGIYVTHRAPRGGQATPFDIGPFELLEARRAIEGETCAIAASRITADRIEELRECLTAMASDDVGESEAADERFHITIADASENSGLSAVVLMLFQARHRSPQYRLMSKMAKAAGVVPRVEEHTLIFAALERRDGKAARTAMRRHLARVLDSFMDTTSTIEIERIQAIVSDQRQRYRLQD